MKQNIMKNTVENGEKTDFVVKLLTKNFTKKLY